MITQGIYYRRFEFTNKECWENSVKLFKDNGVEIIDISLLTQNLHYQLIISLPRRGPSVNLARYDGVRYGFREKADELLDLYECTRSSGFGDEVKQFMIGTYVLSAGYYDAYYLKALKVRN